MADMSKEAEKKHIVLVHGAGMGAWCWYKVATQLRSAGHRVTVPDMAASGIDERSLTQIRSFKEYSEPLFDILRSLPPGEKVILVGHSLGGMNISWATEEFPEKVSAAVFVTALMPDCNNRPSYVMERQSDLRGEMESLWMDTIFSSYEVEDKLIKTMLFGSQFLQSKLGQLCSPEDITLTLSLRRVASIFREDLQSQPPLSKARYGSVDAFYIVCSQDLGLEEEFQRWMANNHPVKEVKTIQNADHIPMLSAPNELCNCLSEIASLVHEK